jgi:hypothetical protein
MAREGQGLHLMTELEEAKVAQQMLYLRNLVDGAPLAHIDDGHLLFEYARTLIDEACGVQTVLMEIWSSRLPQPKVPKPVLRTKVTTDDLLI